MKIDTNIEHTPFQYFLEKCPDISPMDYCAFGFLKESSSEAQITMIDEFWKAVKEKLKPIPLD